MRHARAAETLGTGPCACGPLPTRSRETRFSETPMALPFDITGDARDTSDPRALAILAKTIYRELRASGYAEGDVMALAGELLGMVASEVKRRRTGDVKKTDA